jgi:hypothetical protein
LAVKTLEGLSFRRVASILSELGFKASYGAVRDFSMLLASFFLKLSGAEGAS